MIIYYSNLDLDSSLMLHVIVYMQLALGLGAVRLSKPTLLERVCLNLFANVIVRIVLIILYCACLATGT
jgi:hypothetical protein